MNRLTARKPLMIFIPHCWRLPLPVEYSMPHSKAQTTTLTVNNAHARREKKRTMALTHSSSNSSTPILPMRAKKLPRKPMACP